LIRLVCGLDRVCEEYRGFVCGEKERSAVEHVLDEEGQALSRLLTAAFDRGQAGRELPQEGHDLLSNESHETFERLLATAETRLRSHIGEGAEETDGWEKGILQVAVDVGMCGMWSRVEVLRSHLGMGPSRVSER
jgi:hypothetical protein